MVEGWRKRTGRGIEERMAELDPYVDGYLVTLVESEGRLRRGQRSGQATPAAQGLS